MREGSVIVDLAASTGGNTPHTKNRETVTYNGVKIIGYENFPSRVAGDASKLLAKNIFNFFELLVNKEDNSIIVNLEDDLVKGTIVSHKGAVTFGVN